MKKSIQVTNQSLRGSVLVRVATLKVLLQEMIMYLHRPIHQVIVLIVMNLFFTKKKFWGFVLSDVIMCRKRIISIAVVQI